MSESESMASAKPLSRLFPLTLLLGGLLVATALTMPRVENESSAVARRTMLVRLMPPPLARMMNRAPAQPSAYDEESGMSAAQLLNRWDGFITEASRRFHIPKAWIRAVMSRESGGRTMLGEDKPIVSHAGAVGLMQVMPQTYEQMADRHQLGADPFNAHDNILAGAAYLRWLHQRYGYPAMFAAYNAGPGRVADHLEHGARLPAETRAYVASLTRTLKSHGHNDLDMLNFTRPDGATVKIDVNKVTGIRAAHPGEYASSVKTVIALGPHKQQGVRENVTVAIAAVRATGGLI